MRTALYFTNYFDGNNKWCLCFEEETKMEHNYGIPYARHYEFKTKPTRKQIKQSQKRFKVGFDMYEHYC